MRISSQSASLPRADKACTKRELSPSGKLGLMIPILLRHRFLLDDHLQMRGDVLMELHRDREFPQGFQWLVKLNLAPVEVEALLHERIGNIARSDRAKKLIVLARAPLKRHRHSLKLLGQLLGLGLFLRRTPYRGSLHLHNDCLVA